MLYFFFFFFSSYCPLIQFRLPRVSDRPLEITRGKYSTPLFGDTSSSRYTVCRNRTETWKNVSNIGRKVLSPRDEGFYGGFQLIGEFHLPSKREFQRNGVERSIVVENKVIRF